MKLVLLHPVPDAPTRARAYRDEVALLAAVLRRRGHAVVLVVVGPEDEATLVSALTAPGGQLVLLYVESLAADLAFRAAGVAASILGAPVIPFGPHARLCPDDCLSMTGSEAVAVGPADFAIPAYLEARRSSPDSARTAGLWVKCETGIMRNPPGRPPESLADQPPPARDLYASEEMLDSAGFATIEVARGGEAEAVQPAPNEPTPWPTAAWPVRHRPVASVLAEMRRVAEEQLDLGGWRIGNPRWTCSPAWLAEFAARYPVDAALPFRTTLYAPDVKQETAAVLAKAGGEEVLVNVGSGSAFIRNEVLDLGVSTEALVTAFAALRRAGLRSVARAEIGSPYETADTLEETVKLLRQLDPDRVEAVLHYPAPGTRSHKIAKENGWLVSDAAAAHLAGKPAIALNNLSAEDLWTACEFLPYAIHRPRIVPLLRLARRVKIGKRGTAYERLVKPFLTPPMRRRK